MSSRRRDDTDDAIEQHLDMLEKGDLRGNEIEHSHGHPRNRPIDISNPDDLLSNYNVDMSEENREGSEMSGDDHSGGLQGGEQELETQPLVDSGLPGDETKREEQEIKRQAS